MVQKKRDDALNTTQKKPQLITKYRFWKSQEKPQKIPILTKKTQNEVFLNFFRNYSL